MKRSELILKIRQEARRQGVAWEPVEGAKHDTFWLGSVKIPIPRHTEIWPADNRGHPPRVRS